MEPRKVKPHLFVVDDERAIRDSLTVAFETAGFNVDAYATARDLLGAFEKGATAQCIVADVRMPEMSGLELLKALSGRDMKVPVVLITGHADVPMAVEAMKAGAVDFIEKPFTIDEILPSVASAMQRAAANVVDAVDSDLDRKFQSLTQRERETLELLVVGHTNKSAAQRLAISPRTVEIYRARIMEKMAAKSLAELVRMSMALSR